MFPCHHSPPIAAGRQARPSCALPVSLRWFVPNIALSPIGQHGLTSVAMTPGQRHCGGRPTQRHAESYADLAQEHQQRQPASAQSDGGPNRSDATCQRRKQWPGFRTATLAKVSQDSTPTLRTQEDSPRFAPLAPLHSDSSSALSRRSGSVLPWQVASIAPRSGSATGGRGFSLGAGSFTLLIGLRQLFYAESPAHEHPTGFKVWQPDNKKACQVVCHLTGFVLTLPCHGAHTPWPGSAFGSARFLSLLYHNTSSGVVHITRTVCITSVIRTVAPQTT